MEIRSDLLETTLFLSPANAPRRRQATAFLCSIPFSTTGDLFRNYAHVYLVTARHCVLSTNGAYRTLVAECPWMLGSRVRTEIPADGWVHFTADELPSGEDWVDIAVRPLTEDIYSGCVIGAAIRAIPFEHVADQQFDEFTTPIGTDTATIGLFGYYSGSDELIEPIVRPGKLVMLPKSPVHGELGPMRAYLVECHASHGMSGSPVFFDSGPDPELLGIHVGHALNTFSLADSAAKHEVATPEPHSGVSLVAPAYKLAALLFKEELRLARSVTEQDYIRNAWRFTDRRYRVLRGTAYEEQSFLGFSDYLDEYPEVYGYLLIRPEGFLAVRNWHRDDVCPPWMLEPVTSICNMSVAKGEVERVFGFSGWRQMSDGPSITYSVELARDMEASVELFSDESGCAEAIVLRFSEEREPQVKSLAKSLRCTAIATSHDRVLQRP